MDRRAFQTRAHSRKLQLQITQVQAQAATTKWHYLHPWIILVIDVQRVNSRYQSVISTSIIVIIFRITLSWNLNKKWHIKKDTQQGAFKIAMTF